MATLIGQIRDALRESGGMTASQLADALGEERKRIADTCSEARGRGVLTARRDDGGVVYALADPTAAAPTPKACTNQNAEGATAVPPPVAASKKPKLEKTPREKGRVERLHHKRDFFAAAESANKTLKALLFSRQTAADALEVYVHSCVDPEIYKSLQYAMNAAQAAIDKFSAAGETA